MRELAALLLACAAAAACKDKSASAPAPSAPSAEPPPIAPEQQAAKPRPEPPRLPAAVPAPSGQPITIDEAQKMLPEITSKQILGLKPTSDGKQIHATWCIDGSGADDVARQVGQLMAEAGYTGLAIRGDAKKAGVQGDRDVYRMSMIVSASSAANCPAPEHYFASATIFKP